MNEHTLTQLRNLRLDGMVRAIEEQVTSTALSALGFDERLCLLVQAEVAWRDDKRVQRLLKAAKLKVSSACVEDINWRASRALDRSLVNTLAGGDWIRNAQNLLITGATGCGKTWLACALAHQAARSGFSVLYVRAGRLFDELHIAHGDGSFARRLAQLAKLDVLVIDDFAISPMGAAERNDLLEVLDDRVGTKSTLITSHRRSRPGIPISMIRPWPMPFWTASCTAVTALTSRAPRYAIQRKINDRHRRSARDDLPTASAGTSHAPSAAVDKSAAWQSKESLRETCPNPL